MEKKIISKLTNIISQLSIFKHTFKIVIYVGFTTTKFCTLLWPRHEFCFIANSCNYMHLYVCKNMYACKYVQLVCMYYEKFVDEKGIIEG